MLRGAFRLPTPHHARTFWASVASKPTVPFQGSDFTGIMQVFMIVLRCLIALYNIPQSSITLNRAILFQVRFYLLSNLAFLWSDCHMLRCMHVFVDGSPSIRNEVIFFKFTVAECSLNSYHCGDAHMDNQVSGDPIWTSREAWQLFQLISDTLLFLYNRSQMLLFFVSALCFAWLCFFWSKCFLSCAVTWTVSLRLACHLSRM